MTFYFVIEDEAERELAAAVDFYEARESGLGLRFAREFRVFSKSICDDPKRFPFASRQTRKARLPKPWPYSVYFVIKPHTFEIVISTIWHGARNPSGLHRRLK